MINIVKIYYLHGFLIIFLLIHNTLGKDVEFEKNKSAQFNKGRNSESRWGKSYVKRYCWKKKDSNKEWSN